MTRALLIGREPEVNLPYTYVTQAPFDAVVIGSLPLSQALRLSDEQILQALAEGKPVVLYTPGLPSAPGNRALSAALAASRREMKNWGILFTDGGQKRLITAQEAKQMRLSGVRPGPGYLPAAFKILASCAVISFFCAPSVKTMPQLFISRREAAKAADKARFPVAIGKPGV